MQGVSVPGQRTDEKSDKRNKHLLDLGSIEDVAEYLLGKGKAGPGSTASSSGFTGARSENTEDGNQSDYDGLSSEGEDESEGEEANDRRVELPQNYLGRGNIKNTKKAIRLREIGPRMELGLIKIEQGLGGGDILYHELS
jgi:ribosome biogenesis protein SSF1/2